MDIYLKPLSNKKASFRFPSMPDGRIKVKTQSNYQNYDMIRRGSFSFPSGPDPHTYQWDGYFWGRKHKKSDVNRKWVSPASCIKKLKKWERKGTPLNLIVSGGRIHADVTIKSFSYEPFGGNGDYAYSISFVQYRSLKIYTTAELGIGKKKKKKKSARPSSKANLRQYTIVPGDTLWGISLKFYGTGMDWRKIYDVNREAIEGAARKYGRANSDNGWWIYAGTVLNIPA